MIKKEMIAMLLAGGQGSRLGVLTSKLAKPAVAFGGKYKIIDFPLSNCINSGIDTVGVLTQYQPLRLNQHIGIGIPWDLDRNIGGVSILPPYEKSQNTDWYTGTANAIYQNMEFMEYYHPDYVIILGGDHIYKMDYELMLEFHKKNNAQITLATYEVPWEDASRFGLVITDENNQILEFEEKPANPRSNKASMGIYIFNWEVLKEALETLSEQPGCDFGMHVIPYCHQRGDKIMAYNYQGYWKDVGTLSAYWEANMELIDIIPEFNLYEEFWRIYTKTDVIPPQYFSADSKVNACIVGDGTEVYGEISNSVIGAGVVIEEGAVVTNSIIMNNTVIKKGAKIEKSIIAESVEVGENAELGVFEEAENKYKPKVYSGGLVTIGEGSVIPANVKIGKNVAIVGAGLAGLEAARVAYKRGHTVTVFEKSDRLGGQINIASVPPRKDEILRSVQYYEKFLSDKVDIQLNHEPTMEELNGFDHVILAIGAHNMDLPMSVENSNVVSSWDILNGQEVSGKCVVLGGGLVGAETAEYLANKGLEVSIVEMMDKIAAQESETVLPLMEADFEKHNVQKFVNTRVSEIKDNVIYAVNTKDETNVEIAADTIVNALGSKKNVFDDSKLTVPFTYVGDCSGERTADIASAIRTGYKAANEI